MGQYAYLALWRFSSYCPLNISFLLFDIKTDSDLLKLYIYQYYFRSCCVEHNDNHFCVLLGTETNIQERAKAGI